MGVIFVAGMVGFCGSRSLPASSKVSELVSGVVGSVLAGVPRRDVAVGCAIGGDALVVSSALAAGASSRLRVFAAFGPVSPALAYRPRFCSRRLVLRLFGLGRGRSPRRRRLRLLVGRGWSLSPPGRPPRLPLLSTRLRCLLLRSRRRPRGLRLRCLPPRSRPFALACRCFLGPSLRLMELPRSGRWPRAPNGRLPLAAIRIRSQPRPSRLLAWLVGSALRRVGWWLSLRPRPASAGHALLLMPKISLQNMQKDVGKSASGQYIYCARTSTQDV